MQVSPSTPRSTSSCPNGCSATGGRHRSPSSALLSHGHTQPPPRDSILCANPRWEGNLSWGHTAMLVTSKLAMLPSRRLKLMSPVGEQEWRRRTRWFGAGRAVDFEVGLVLCLVIRLRRPPSGSEGGRRPVAGRGGARGHGIGVVRCPGTLRRQLCDGTYDGASWTPNWPVRVRRPACRPGRPRPRHHARHRRVARCRCRPLGPPRPAPRPPAQPSRGAPVPDTRPFSPERSLLEDGTAGVASGAAVMVPKYRSPVSVYTGDFAVQSR